jgi:hypothetical protein
MTRLVDLSGSVVGEATDITPLVVRLAAGSTGSAALSGLFSSLMAGPRSPE